LRSANSSVGGEDKQKMWSGGRKRGQGVHWEGANLLKMEAIHA